MVRGTNADAITNVDRVILCVVLFGGRLSKESIFKLIARMRSVIYISATTRRETSGRHLNSACYSRGDAALFRLTLLFPGLAIARGTKRPPYTGTLGQTSP